MDNGELLERLRSRNPSIYHKAYKEVYHKAFRICASFVLRNSGTEDDAGDAFRDALVILLQKVRNKPDFQLTSKIETLLYGITRNIWMRQLDKRQRSKIDFVEDMPFDQNAQNDADHFMEEDSRENDPLGSLLIHAMKTLDNFDKEDCKQVIRLFYLERQSLRDIAAQTGYSENYTKRKKGNCLKYLRKRIQETYQPPKN